MKRFIRYLYEYEQGKRIRNVGFVKIETGSEETSLNVQAKGFQGDGDRRLLLYLFYKENGELVRFLRDNVTIVSPAFNASLRYTKEDVKEPSNYEKINGILLVTESGRHIAATWDDKAVDVSRMREFTKQIEHQEEVEGWQNEENEKPFEAGKKVTKILRQDISKLPRCEWKLANNEFLMHGYENYHYLVLIEEENILKLGVPGIYHIKEEKYAKMFGFGEFFPVDEKFGYWVRPVRRRKPENMAATDIKEKYSYADSR